MRPGILRRLCVLSMLGALALQMGLPVAHASVHAAFASIGAQAQGSQPPDLRPAAAHASAHDPRACRVCQSLHAKPALPLAQPARALPERGPALVATAQCAESRTAQSDHPPRAPPLEALSLA